MRSVLVTGSAGFIGSHLCEFYLKKGYRVYGLDNYITGSEKNTSDLISAYPEYFHFTRHDVTQPWPQLPLKNLQYVFHLASPAAVKMYQKYPLETMQANSVGLQNALSLADRNAGRLIFASTSEIYGSPLSTPQKESDWGHVNPFGERSCYDEGKRFGEALIFSHNKVHQTEHGLVRIFNTYGPRMHTDDDRVVNTFLKQALMNTDLVIYGNGKQTRSFCYIDDLINGLNLYAESHLKEPVNLGNDEETTIYQLAELVLHTTESKSKIRYEPLPANDPPQRRPDLTHAREKLKFRPAYSLHTGLKKMIK